MKKKIFCLIGILVFAVTILSVSFTTVKADGVPETETPETEEVVEEEPEEVFESKIVATIGDGGDVLFDKNEGHVGDVVTAYVRPDFLFKITSIKINGVITEVSKDSQYKFKLIEGNNTFDVEFAINNEKLTEVANLIQGVKNNGFSSLFTMSNLLNLISWVISIFLSSGFFITLIKTRRLKGKTIDQVVEVVNDTINKKIDEAILNFLKNVLGKTLDTILEKMDNNDECMKVLCRCFLLQQEDTPESRLAIIEELTKLSTDEEALSNKIRQIVLQEQEKHLKAIEERDKTIEELKQKNQSITEEQTEDYGQI